MSIYYVTVVSVMDNEPLANKQLVVFDRDGSLRELLSFEPCVGAQPTDSRGRRRSEAPPQTLPMLAIFRQSLRIELICVNELQFLAGAPELYVKVCPVSDSRLELKVRRECRRGKLEF